MMWSEVVKDKQSEARGFLSWKRIWSLLVESHVNAMTQMTNPFFGGERRTKGRRFLWVWVEERSEGKYSEWRGGTTQCQRDSPLYISIPVAVKKLNVWVKNDSKEESSILNLKLKFFNINIIAHDCENFAWSVNSFNNMKKVSYWNPDMRVPKFLLPAPKKIGFQAQKRPNLAQNWHFGPNISIFGPFDLMPDQKTMRTSCLDGFLLCWYQNFYLLP